MVSVCSFLRNHPTGLHGNDHTSSFPESLPACCHLFPSDWDEVESQTILTCISLVTKDTDDFFKNLLAICFLLLRFLNVYFCKKLCVLFYEWEHTETSPRRPLLGTVWCPLSIWRWNGLFWAPTNPVMCGGQVSPVPWLFALASISFILKEHLRVLESHLSITEILFFFIIFLFCGSPFQKTPYPMPTSSSVYLLSSSSSKLQVLY